MSRTLRKQFLRVVFYGIPILGIGWFHGIRRSAFHDSTATIQKSALDDSRKEPLILPKGLRYGVERKLRTRIISKSGRKSVIDLNHKGEIQLNPVPAADGISRYRISLRLNFTNPEASPSLFQDLESRHPVEVRLTPDFHLISLHVENSQNQENPDELNLMRDLISILAYQSLQDTTGNYEAQWDASPPVIRKRKLRYVSPKLSTIRILSSLHEIRVRENGVPVSMEGGERMQMAISKGVELETESIYRFQLLNASSNPSFNLSLREESEWMSVGLDLDAVPASSVKSSYEVPSARAIEEKLSGLLEVKPADRLGLFHEMVSVFRRAPERIADFIPMVFGLGVPRERTQFGIGVLANLDQDLAQRALLDAYRSHEADPALQHLILNSLATSGVALRDDTRKALLDLPGSDESIAFVLGSSLRITPNDQVRERLRSLFMNAGEENRRIVALEAIGNSGDAFFIPLLKESLQSSSERIRAKAAFATRFLSDSIKGDLLDSVSRDGSELVFRAVQEARQFSPTP